MRQKHKKSHRNWEAAQESIQRARQLCAKYDVDKVHPSEYAAHNPEQELWDDLLNRMK